MQLVVRFEIHKHVLGPLPSSHIWGFSCSLEVSTFGLEGLVAMESIGWRVYLLTWIHECSWFVWDLHVDTIESPMKSPGSSRVPKFCELTTIPNSEPGNPNELTNTYHYHYLLSYIYIFYITMRRYVYILYMSITHSSGGETHWCIDLCFQSWFIDKKTSTKKWISHLDSFAAIQNGRAQKTHRGCLKPKPSCFYNPICWWLKTHGFGDSLWLKPPCSKKTWHDTTS